LASNASFYAQKFTGEEPHEDFNRFKRNLQALGPYKETEWETDRS